MIDVTIIGQYAFLKTGEHKGKIGKVMVNEQVKYYLLYKGNFQEGHSGEVKIPDDIPPYVLMIVDDVGNIICVIGAFREDLSVIGMDNEHAPCGRSTQSGGSGVTETYHSMPYTKGRVNVTYQMYGVPDMMEVFFVHETEEGGESLELLGTTGRFVSHTGTISFDYDPKVHPWTVMVRMTGNSSGTAWNYTLNCPIPDDI